MVNPSQEEAVSYAAYWTAKPFPKIGCGVCFIATFQVIGKTQSLEEVEEASAPEHGQSLRPLVHPLLQWQQGFVQLRCKGWVALCHHGDRTKEDHVCVDHLEPMGVA